MGNRQEHRAFTLIELLTVVAIISLLISILTPSLSRARAQAKATACGARMHEYGLALIIYSNDSGGHLPVAEFLPGGQDNTRFGWAELIGEQTYSMKAPVEPNEHFPFQCNTHNIGRFHFRYFNCPALGKESDHSGHYRVYLPAWSYGSFTRGSGRKIDPDHPANPKLSPSLDQVPLHLPLLGDARKRDLNAYASSYISGGEAAGLQGFDDRHYGRINLLYADGHSQLTRYDPNDPENFFARLNDDWDLDGVYEFDPDS